MVFDLPAGQILAVDDADIRLAAGPHPFALGREAEIAANWAEEIAAKSALFDGEIALLAGLRYRGGRLSGDIHLVRYATFLLWRKLRPVPEAGHIFAHAMPVTSEGALLAVRMSAATLNGGQVYFAAGSFEREDILDGRVDIEGNMAREVLEETGLVLSEARRESVMHAYSGPDGTVLFRRYFLPMTAAEAQAEVRAHIRFGAEDEIDAPVIIRGAGDHPPGLAPHMPALIDWHFRNAN